MNSKLLIAPELNERRTNFKICIQIINDEHGCTDIKQGHTNFIIGRAYKVKVNANRQETVRKRNKMTRT